jgi:hypothetical protein
MDDVDVIEDVEEDTEDRVSVSVRHALRLVGPAEGGAERYWVEAQPFSPPASRAK